MKKILLKFYNILSYLLFDPILKIKQYYAIPFFLKNLILYKISYKNTGLPIRLKDLYITTADRFMNAGVAKGHYFFQDLWAAKKVYESGKKEHVDVGSRIDGFVAHLLPFCKVKYVDIRPLGSTVEGLEFIKGSITNLPFEDNSVHSLSCLHVVEHIGLGRYGDDLDPLGHEKAAKELARVLAPGGLLCFGTPVGNERVCFDAHRIFNPQTVVQMFPALKLVEFSLIGDKGDSIIEHASIEQASTCNYACGLFLFVKE